MTSEVIYKGELNTQATHLQSSTSIFTDAPIDNMGKGQNFSPTDLIATSLASCMMTIMGIAANTHQIDIENTKAEVTKIMQANPRRIAEIKIELYFPATSVFDEKQKKILENAAKTCPVALSLHPDIIQNIIFHW